MKAAMHVLYGAGSGNSIRAAIALLEAGIAFDAVRVDLAKSEQHSPAFATLNPHRKVPVLIIRDAARQVITQSNAIMIYASEKATTPLLPEQGASRWLALERYFYFVTDVIATGHAGFHLRQTGDSAMGLAADWLAARSRAAALAAEGFLAGAQFIAGPELTLADISAFTFMRSVQAQLDWPALPRVAEWHARLASRPAFARGAEAFGAAKVRRFVCRPTNGSDKSICP
jgi:GSH-dependent disulfide-bond oxidoreductase